TAFVVDQGFQCLFVVDGKEYGPYPNKKMNVAFSPDGKHFAFVASGEEGCFVVLDGEKGKAYEDIRVFGNENVVWDGSKTLRYFALHRGAVLAVEEEVE
ncbi:MAG: hypothetical protein ACYTHM_21835, partial [Planctomycetota bacterium]